MSSRLGEILVKDSLISSDQLKQALDYQKKNGGRLGTCLVKLGLVSDEDITNWGITDSGNGEEKEDWEKTARRKPRTWQRRNERRCYRS